MRLIQTTSPEPELVYFVDEQTPKYAILSHVWGEEEVTFQHMQDPSQRKGMKGWSKIVRACELARSEEWDYIWIDTCCIDKSSSAELSEAINSMYRYYHEAPVCYAYLADVRSDIPRRSFSFSLEFRGSRWFTRGWTLQELIAPMTVVFFTQNWERIGTKASLEGIITEVTGIPSNALLDFGLGKCSIAARMSWAAGRKTTRIEDRAYSLMGIFGVYMPPIYGEGKHAFIRLQEEILKTSADQTIFAWKSGNTDGQGLLATSPDDFGASGEYVPRVSQSDNRQPFSMTNMGLLAHLPLLPIIDRDQSSNPRQINHDKEFLVLLNAGRPGHSLAIHVRKDVDGHQYERVRSDELVEDDATILAKCGRIERSPQELLLKAWDPRDDSDRYRYGYERVAVCFPRGQGIEPLWLSQTETYHYPIVTEFTNTGNYSKGVFTPRSNVIVFLFAHKPDGQNLRRLFALVVGDLIDSDITGRIWLDLVALPITSKKIPPGFLSRIREPYITGGGLIDVPAKSFEKSFGRISQFLTGDVAILAEAQRRNPNSQNVPSPSCCILNISIIDKSHPAIALSHACKYAFNVSFIEAMYAGYSLLEAYPENFWEAQCNGTMSLFLDDTNISGILLFQLQEDRQGFIVSLGVHNDTVWSDVHVLTATECERTAKDICDSYHNDQGRIQLQKRIRDHDNNPILYASEYLVRLRETPNQSELDLHDDVSVRSDAIGKSHRQYKSQICVQRGLKIYRF